MESADKVTEYGGNSRSLHFALMNTFILAIAVIPTNILHILFLFFGKLLMQVISIHSNLFAALNCQPPLLVPKLHELHELQKACICHDKRPLSSPPRPLYQTRLNAQPLIWK